MKTILAFAIFATVLAIPQFTNNATLAHSLRTTSQNYDKKQDACRAAKKTVKHGHQHKFSDDNCDCEKLDGLWSCTVTYG